MEEGDNNDDRTEWENSVIVPGGGWYTRNKESSIALRSPLGRSTPEEEYARARSDNRTNGKERLRQKKRECAEGRRLVERRRKLDRESERSRLRRRETKRGERASKRRTTVQSGGTRGARKAVVCRGPPHWHTVIRYDPHRTSTRTSDLTVINEVTIRQVLVQCRLAKSPLISWQIDRQQDKALTRPHLNRDLYIFNRKGRNLAREGGRVPTDRIVVGRARGREKPTGNFIARLIT